MSREADAFESLENVSKISGLVVDRENIFQRYLLDYSADLIRAYRAREDEFKKYAGFTAEKEIVAEILKPTLLIDTPPRTATYEDIAAMVTVEWKKAGKPILGMETSGMDIGLFLHLVKSDLPVRSLSTEEMQAMVKEGIACITLPDHSGRTVKDALQ